jgi:hypothetical protein
VKWRFSAQAGGVEGSKFCLFMAALPARCVSSISPRFHFRWHAFCFLPLVTILEYSFTCTPFKTYPFVICVPEEFMNTEPCQHPELDDLGIRPSSRSHKMGAFNVSKNYFQEELEKEWLVLLKITIVKFCIFNAQIFSALFFTFFCITNFSKIYSEI